MYWLEFKCITELKISVFGRIYKPPQVAYSDRKHLNRLVCAPAGAPYPGLNFILSLFHLSEVADVIESYLN